MDNKKNMREAFLRLALFACVALLLGVGSCKDDNPIKPPPSAPDTTSHTFVWYTDTLGARLSRVNDVFCLSENDAYAVGYFYQLDSTGKIDSQRTANLAHWDGVRWTLIRVNPMWQGHQTFGEHYAVYAFSENDVWLGEAMHGNGKNQWTAYDVNAISTGRTRKIWGNRPDNVYFAGENGSLMHWNGQEFRQINTQPTTAAFCDVWGVEDTVYVAVSDYDHQSGYKGYLLRIINGAVVDKRLLEFTELLTVWGIKGTWYAGGCNGNIIFKKEASEWRSISIPTQQCKAYIRGTSLNDVFIAADRRILYHYNGKTMKEILPVDNDAALIDGLSTAGKTVFLADTKNGFAHIYRGYRQE